MGPIERFCRVFVWCVTTTLFVGLFMGWAKVVVITDPSTPWWKWVALVAGTIAVGGIMGLDNERARRGKNKNSGND